MAGDRYLDPEFDDTSLPQEDDLAALAHQGELAAIGLPAAAVRRLGARRRRRRRAAVGVGTLALVVLAGGVAVGNTSTVFTPEPPVVATPTPAPSTSSVPSPTASARTLTAANLLTAEDVPRTEGRESVEEVSEVDRSSPCVPDNDLGRLGPTSTLSRAFVTVPVGPDAPSPDPSVPQPLVLATALQFADETAAERAVTTYQGWLDDCREAMPSQGYVALGDTTAKVPTTTADPGVTGATGSFSDLVYRDQTDESGAGTFESTGLTRVGDRVMVTVRFLYSTEDHVSMSAEEQRDTGLPLHPQFALVEAAAERLSR